MIPVSLRMTSRHRAVRRLGVDLVWDAVGVAVPGWVWLASRRRAISSRVVAWLADMRPKWRILVKPRGRM